MTSIRIHEDQENQNVGIRQKQNTVAAHLKRTAFGIIDKNQVGKDKPSRKVRLPVKPKIPLTHKVNDSNNDDKENVRINGGHNGKNLVIPVAQFEAFKVYEDNMKVTGGRPVMPDVDEFYKHSNALITKKDLMIMTFGEDRKALTVSEYRSVIKNEQFTESQESMNTDAEEQRESESVKADSPMNVSIIEKTPEKVCKENEEPSEITMSRRDLLFDVEEYREDIYKYLREHELRNRAKPGYMKKQPDITYEMRRVLVDWLVEVAAEYKMGCETWYLAVNYIDRFLSYMSVVRGKLQLVGTAAIFIAAKYEEIYPPEVQEYVYITADTYCQRQIIRMEQLILKVLNFDLSVPTPYTFINWLCSMVNLPETEKNLALYVCELSVFDTDKYINSLPSLLAASSVALARHTFDKEMWPEEYAKVTGYELEHLHCTIEFLSGVHNNAPTHLQRAIPEKYAQSTYGHIAQIKAKPLITFAGDGFKQ